MHPAHPISTVRALRQALKMNGDGSVAGGAAMPRSGSAGQSDALGRSPLAGENVKRLRTIPDASVLDEREPRQAKRFDNLADRSKYEPTFGKWHLGHRCWITHAERKPTTWA
jgi:hypothetical protein